MGHHSEGIGLPTVILQILSEADKPVLSKICYYIKQEMPDLYEILLEEKIVNPGVEYRSLPVFSFIEKYRPYQLSPSNEIKGFPQITCFPGEAEQYGRDEAAWREEQESMKRT